VGLVGGMERHRRLWMNGIAAVGLIPIVQGPEMTVAGKRTEIETGRWRGTETGTGCGIEWGRATVGGGLSLALCATSQSPWPATPAPHRTPPPSS